MNAKEASYGAVDAVGVVCEGEEIAVGGLNPWELKWRVLADEAIELPHPSYPLQRHRMLIYEIGDGETNVIFAAGELFAECMGLLCPAEESFVVIRVHSRVVPY
jgi:hypothetical protein